VLHVAGNLPAAAAYLGQTLPGEAPTLFAPDVLAANKYPAVSQREPETLVFIAR
jgi:hypothetical protein